MRCDHCALPRCVFPWCQAETVRARVRVNPPGQPIRMLTVARWNHVNSRWELVMRKSYRDSLLGLQRPPPPLRLVKS